MEQSSRVELFESMTEVADILSRESSVLGELVEFIADADIVAKRVSALELEADEVNHVVASRFRDSKLAQDEDAMGLFKVFSLLEECTDAIEDLAVSIVSYNVTSLREEMISDLVAIDSCVLRGINPLVFALKDEMSYADSKKLIILINHFKDMVAKNCSTNLRELFVRETNPIEIIRWKEIINFILNVFIAFEDFADECEEYLLKNKQ